MNKFILTFAVFMVLLLPSVQAMTVSEESYQSWKTTTDDPYAFVNITDITDVNGNKVIKGYLGSELIQNTTGNEVYNIDKPHITICERGQVFDSTEISFGALNSKPDKKDKCFEVKIQDFIAGSWYFEFTIKQKNWNEFLSSEISFGNSTEVVITENSTDFLINTTDATTLRGFSANIKKDTGIVTNVKWNSSINAIDFRPWQWTLWRLNNGSGASNVIYGGDGEGSDVTSLLYGNSDFAELQLTSDETHGGENWYVDIEVFGVEECVNLFLKAPTGITGNHLFNGLLGNADWTGLNETGEFTFTDSAWANVTEGWFCDISINHHCYIWDADKYQMYEVNLAAEGGYDYASIGTTSGNSWLNPVIFNNNDTFAIALCLNSSASGSMNGQSMWQKFTTTNTSFFNISGSSELNATTGSFLNGSLGADNYITLTTIETNPARMVHIRLFNETPATGGIYFMLDENDKPIGYWNLTEDDYSTNFSSEENGTLYARIYMDGTDYVQINDSYTAPFVDPSPNVTITSPLSNSWNTSKTIDFSYIPWDDQLVVNCSLWTNETAWSLKQSNASQITNNTAELIQETFSADGSYVWNIECYDNATTPNTNTSIINYTIRIDSTSPATTPTSPTNITYGTVIVDLNATVIEENPSLVFAEVDDTYNVSLTNTSGNWNYTNSTTDNGFHFVRFFANDSAGNMNATGYTYFTVDSIAPTTAIYLPLNYTWNNTNSQVFTCSAWDNINLTNLSQYSNTTGTWQLNDTNNPANNTNSTFSMYVSDGVYVWNCEGCDAIDNCSMATANYTLLVDTTAPSTTDNYTDSAWNNTDQGIALTCTDTGSGCNNTWYCVDWADTCTPNTTGTLVNMTDEGTSYLRYLSDDNASNNETVNSQSFRLDKSNPTYSGGTQNSTLAGTFVNHSEAWYDAFSGLSCYIFSWTNGTATWSNDSAVCGFSTAFATKFINDTNGVNISWAFFVNDTAGHWNSSNHSYLTSADSPPNVTLNSPLANNVTTVTNQNFSITAWDDNKVENCTLYVWWDNGTLFNSTLNTTTITNNSAFYTNITDFINGTYYWNSQCFDNASQSAWSVVNYTLTIDLEPPDITIFSPTNSTYTTASIDLNFTATENLSWSAYSLNGGANISTSMCYQETANESTFCGGLNTGMYSFTGSWSGGAGNTYDGDYSTSAFASGASTAYTYVNYTKPFGSSSDSLWQTRGNLTTANVSISSCWDYNSTTLIFRASSYRDAPPSRTNFQCLNASGWQNVSVGTATDKIYEEGMFWSMPSNRTITAPEGFNNITVWGNDTLGNINRSNYVYFYVDLTDPTSNSPSDTGYQNNTEAWINWTLQDEHGAGHYIVFRNGTVYNATTSWTNATDLAIVINTTFAEGFWNYTIMFNDSAGNWGINDSVMITVDETTPNISILLPENITYTGTSTALNYTVFDAFGTIDTCFYSLDGGVNTTIASCANTTLTSLTYTFHNVTVWVNDTAGNLNYSTVYFRMFYASYNISILDEMTGNILNISGTNTSLRVFCPDETMTWNVTEFWNITNGSFTITDLCQFDEIRLTIEDGSTEYYRTLIPETVIGNITFYMIDLLNDTLIELTLFINDVTGDFLSEEWETVVHIKKVVVDAEETMIDQIIDAETKVILSLIVGEKYKISIQNNVEDRSMGYLLADDTTEKTVTISQIPFEPIEFYLMKDVRYGFTSNASTTTISLIYDDRLNETISVDFYVYNASNVSQLIYSDSSTSPTVTFTYNGVDLNTTYLVKMIALHSRYGTLTEIDTIGFGYATSFHIAALETLGISDTWYPLMAMFFVIITAMLFSRVHAGAGTIITALMILLFFYWGWFNSLSQLAGGVVILVVVLAFVSKLAESRRQQ